MLKYIFPKNLKCIQEDSIGNRMIEFVNPFALSARDISITHHPTRDQSFVKVTQGIHIQIDSQECRHLQNARIAKFLTQRGFPPNTLSCSFLSSRSSIQPETPSVWTGSQLGI